MTAKKKKILNKITSQENFDCDEFLGIEVEEEDRSVGIFGNIFGLGFKNDTGKSLWVDIGDETFDILLDKLKPFIDEREALKKFDKECYDNWIKEQKEHLEDK
jgi:hypothetical protein